MGLVSQEPALFNETIRANIAYGKDGQATESEITAAAELANAHRFISSSLQVRLSPLNLPKLGIGFAIQLCTTKHCC
jgi:ABC-type multidrug transport system fused ATPase/permease subunit